MRFIIPTLISFTLFFATQLLGNTCTIDNTGSSMNPPEVILNNSLAGQQFIACETGEITAIQINTPNGGDVHLYLTAGDGSSGITVGSPTQTFVGQPAGVITLELEMPFAVEEGELYAFAIGNITEIIFDASPTGAPANNTDPDGRFSFEINSSNAFTVNSSSDLEFGVTITTPAPSVAAPLIPTLSQWGLLILALFILNLNVYFIKRRLLV